ncbi:odorant receptor 67a-like [Pseudomyrmex gracilis]|uniref:odorant receptor 67a-like n=1 Tax=Pseudomyrmex gracilis TaxID=219809 RepID=UPI000995D3F6|nr:odorant receptor 67a-like [Pseudomyrmex gracilis]
MLENFLREYNLNRIFLSNIGFWPFQNKRVRILLQTLCFLLEMSYCPFEILLLCDHWDDGQMIFEGCYQIVLSASFLVRLINEVWNRNEACDDQMIHLYQTIDDHWNIFTNDIEVRVLKDYSILSKKFTRYYSLLMYCLMSGFIVIPLTPVFLDVVLPLYNATRPRFLAFEVEFRIDTDEYFLFCFGYTTAIAIVGISIMVSVDAMRIACTAHACSLFMAVSQRLESIIVEANGDEKKLDGYEHRKLTSKESELREETMYRDYIGCLKKHQLAIEFVNIMESSYKGLSLSLLLLSIATLSLIGIRIIYVLDQLGEAIRFAFIIVGALMTVLIPCYSGQKLIDESQNVFYRAYAVDWYNFSPRLKSLLMITLSRSNIPCDLKAGNMISLSIATYAAVSVCVCV